MRSLFRFPLFFVTLVAVLSQWLMPDFGNANDGEQVEITLDRAWIFAGTTYLPGTHKVNADLARIFRARGAFPSEPVAGHPAQLTATIEHRPDDAHPGTQIDPLIELVGTDVSSVLRTAGYGAPEAIAAADDATLLALDHVGAATLKKLRSFKG